MIKILTNKELDDKYGNHMRYKKDECFMTNDGHYYMQREEDVLHLNDDIINLLHNSILDRTDITKISKEEFIDKIKLVIFNLGIYNFTLNNK